MQSVGEAINPSLLQTVPGLLGAIVVVVEEPDVWLDVVEVALFVCVLLDSDDIVVWLAVLVVVPEVVVVCPVLAVVPEVVGSRPDSFVEVASVVDVPCSLVVLVELEPVLVPAF